MKIVKGTEWLKREFVEQLKQLLETNRVVELDKLVKFDGKKQFIKNMLIRTEIAVATGDDIEWQIKIEDERRREALKNAKHQDKLKQEEKQLQEKMGI